MLNYYEIFLKKSILIFIKKNIGCSHQDLSDFIFILQDHKTHYLRFIRTIKGMKSEELEDLLFELSANDYIDFFENGYKIKEKGNLYLKQEIKEDEKKDFEIVRELINVLNTDYKKFKDMIFQSEMFKYSYIRNNTY